MKSIRRPFLSLLAGTALVLVASAPVFAQGLIVDRELPAEERPTTPVRNAGISIQSHLIEVTIKDQVATTKVTEVFFNPNKAPNLEATFFFPLPEEASINQFSMTMNGRMVEGEVLEASQARGIYEGIVRRQKDPGLLEYVGRKLFRARIFPVTPEGTTTVVMTYTQLLDGENGLVRYSYPLDTSKFTDLKTSEVVLKVDIESQQPLRAVYSPSHEVDLTRRGDNKAVAGYEGKDVVTSRDFLLYYTLNPDDVGLSLLTYKDGNEDGYFMLIASPRQEYKADEIQPKDIVFVVDVSGSMNADDKITQAKNALKYCLQNLNPNDRFNIVPFSTVAKLFREDMVSVEKDNVAAAMEYVDSLRATGGTAIDEALKTGLGQLTAGEKNDARVPMIVFMTDGLPTVGERNIANILKNAGTANTRNVRLFNFGVGNDVNTHLLDKLAESTRGAREYIAPAEDIEARVSSFYEKVSSPVLANLKLNVGSVESFDIFPRAMPDLFKGSQLVLFGRYRKTGKQDVILSGTVAGKPAEFKWTGEFVEDNAKNDFLPRLWALRKVGFLMDEIRLNGFNQELKDEIVRLGTRFGIVTPYTSFLVVEDSELQNMPQPQPGAERLRGDADDRNGNRWGRDGAAESPRNPAPPAADPSGLAPVDEARREGQQGANEPGASSNAGPGHGFSGGVGGGGRPADNAAGDSRLQSGEDAVKRSKELEKLKDMTSLEEALDGKKADGSQGGQLARKAIADKTFMFRAGWWIDTTFDPSVHKDAKRVEVEAFSDAYFELLRKISQLAKYASVGERCVVVHDGIAYVIQPKVEPVPQDEKKEGEQGSGD
ncbi:MAG: VIT domain-containing protein [Planctomycetota bacterium]